MSSNPNNAEPRRFETGRISTETPVNAGVFSLIGKLSDDVNLEHFVEHAALNAEVTELRLGNPASVFHMCPPLAAASINTTPASQDKCRADLLADVDLLQDEVNAMKVWRAQVEKYKSDVITANSLAPFREYVIHPHKEAVKSEVGRTLYWRYSCAGLVIDCYEHAGIETIDHSSAMPEIDEETLKECYPDIAKLQKKYEEKPNSRALAKFGFRGIADLGLKDKPWRPILVGYLFHAFIRFCNNAPRPGAYVPNSCNERFFDGSPGGD